jgi:hypothetical protein
MTTLPHTDNAHPVVDTVGDIEIPLRVYTTAVGALQARCRGRPTVAIAALVPTGDGRDDASHGIDAADGSVQPVHDIDIPVRIHLQRVQVIQRRRGGRAAVTSVALPTARSCRCVRGCLTHEFGLSISFRINTSTSSTKAWASSSQGWTSCTAKRTRSA